MPLPPLPQPVSVEVEMLLNALIAMFKENLGAGLAGIYLHGSLAMGCFNPRSSDVDLLIVVGETLSILAKQQLTQALLGISDRLPKPGIELSVVTFEAAQQFQYPTPYEFHFSDAWKDRYRANTVDFDEQRFDPDLAAHIAVTLNRGICLYGQPIQTVFSAVPDKYFRYSILNDAHDIFVNITKNPVYGILNLCRSLAYLSDHQIRSKAEGGEWGLKNIEPQYTALIRQALEEYRDQDRQRRSWGEAELKNFADNMVGLIESDNRAGIAFP